jgi:lipoyl-dependent peroxiredoxin subunit D
MSALEALREAFPESARDTKLNLSAVLGDGALTPAQRWGVAVASAAAAKSPRLLAALLEEARPLVPAAALEDALAAASLMGMNNVYYRFRHFSGKKEYEEKPARLRMTRLGKPAASKAELELFSLAVSALNGCEACVKAHEHAVTTSGLTPDQVHDAVRIAAVVNAAAVALVVAEALNAVPLMEAVAA